MLTTEFTVDRQSRWWMKKWYLDDLHLYLSYFFCFKLIFHCISSVISSSFLSFFWYSLSDRLQRFSSLLVGNLFIWSWVSFSLHFRGKNLGCLSSFWSWHVCHNLKGCRFVFFAGKLFFEIYSGNLWIGELSGDSLWEIWEKSWKFHEKEEFFWLF